MKIYRKVISIVEDGEMSEKYCFNYLIEEIRYWSETDEVDFMQAANPGFISKFSTMNSKDINTNLEELRRDIIDLRVRDFWNKYEDKLIGKWHNNKKVIV